MSQSGFSFMESLSPKVIQSGLWSLGCNWITRGMGVIKLIVLARLLSPIEFGVLGLAILSINILRVFSETGIESALIQKDKISRAELDTAWTISLIRGLVLFCILFMSAGWFASYFNNATLEPVLKLMASVFIFEGFVNIGLVYFQRELAFKKKVRLDLASDIAGAIATIIMAFWLRNVWALVLGTMVWTFVKCFGSYYMHSYRPKLLWDWSLAKSLLNFGIHIFWISIVTFIVTSIDDALVGKLLGLTALGFYTMAYNIANMLVSSLSGIIGKVSFPAYSILQNEPQRLAEAFSRVIEAVLIFLLPITVLMIFLAKDFTLIFLGNKWLPMVPVLKILSLLGFFRSLSNVLAPIQLAVNRPDIQSKNKMIEIVIFAILIYPFTIKWGLIGASWAVTLVYLASLIVNALSSAYLIPSFFLILIRTSWVPILASCGLLFSTFMTYSWLNELNGTFQLILSGLSGLVVFAIIVLAIRKNFAKEIFLSFYGTEI
jgi:O-antigen/teichoic acid export membrane protein